MARSAVLPLLWLALACGSGPEQRLEKAQAELAAGDYAEASASAEDGLAAGAQGATAWRLELIALEGEARVASTPAVLSRLERLGGSEWSSQVTGALYVQTASQVKEAGDAAGAIGVLDLGAKRFPDDPDLRRAIERLKTSGSDAEIERLRSLGYVE